MINIQIPKDVREYEPKFFGPLTFRQAVCLVIAALIEMGGVFLQKNILGLPTASYIPPLPLAAIPLLIGWGKQIFHMEAEVFIRNVLIHNIMCPSKRIYQTMNYYDVYLTKHTEQDGKKKDRKQQKKRSSKEDANLPAECRAYD